MHLAVKVYYWTRPLPELLGWVRCCWLREASWLVFMLMPGYRMDSLATWVFWLWLGTVFSRRWCYELASLPWQGSNVQWVLHDLLRSRIMQEYALNSLHRWHHWFCSVDGESNRFCYFFKWHYMQGHWVVQTTSCVCGLGSLFR